MKYLATAAVFVAGFAAAQFVGSNTAADPKPAPPENPSIDMDGYLKISQVAAKHRATRRISEEDFLRMSQEKGTIVLDARSKEMYDLLHVKGAINLSFPNIDALSLPKLLPDKSARILIYCNNNFTPASDVQSGQSPKQATTKVGEVAERAFQPKSRVASLNLSTYISLYTYGYRNVYELAPLIDPEKSKLTFETNVKALDPSEKAPDR